MKQNDSIGCDEVQCPVCGNWTREGWISVKELLPFDNYDEETKWCVTGEFLVTVQLDDPDPNDDPQVCMLNYSVRSGWTSNGTPYNLGWHVTHWMRKPEPAKEEQ